MIWNAIFLLKPSEPYRNLEIFVNLLFKLCLESSIFGFDRYFAPWIRIRGAKMLRIRVLSTE